MAPGARKRLSLVLNLASPSPTLSPATTPNPSMPTTPIPRSPFGVSTQINSPTTTVPPAVRNKKLVKRVSRRAHSVRDLEGAENESLSRTNSSRPTMSASVSDPILSAATLPPHPFSPSSSELFSARRELSPSSSSSKEYILSSSHSAYSMASQDFTARLSPEMHQQLLSPSYPHSQSQRQGADDCMSIISGMAIPLEPRDAESRRIAKLTRHLGEPITAEHLSSGPLPEAEQTYVEPSRRLGRPGAMVRRMSLDMSTLISPLLSPSSVTPLVASPVPDSTTPLKSSDSGVRVKRTRSLWVRKARPSLEPDNPMFPSPAPIAMQPGLSENEWMASAGPKLRPTSPPLPERQRVLNVKRAKKMTELFGSEPPAALFQIKHLDFDQDALLTPATPRRASIGTFYPEDSLRTPTSEHRSSWLSTNPHEGKRTSTLTIVSLASMDTRHSRRHSSVHCLTHHTDQDLMSPPLTPRSPAPETSRHHIPAILPDTPSSPPPFATCRKQDPTVPFSAYIASTIPSPPVLEAEDIWTRRKRAQKLGQFFGVETREIPTDSFDPSMPMFEPRAASPAPTAFLGADVSSDGEREADVRVDVKIGGSRLWGFRKEPDMEQAMVTLRAMRAS